MENKVKMYNVVVIGCGHAGIEAANASSKLVKTAIVVANQQDVGKLSCNPSIGGLTKSQLICELTCVGGIMGQLADKSATHIDTLNKSRGRAVRALRIQVDREMYRTLSLEILNTLTVIYDEVIDIIHLNNKILLKLASGSELYTKAVVVATGPFGRATCHIGECVIPGGKPLTQRQNCMLNLFNKYGIRFKRFKTSTPPRLIKTSINWEHTQPMPSEKPLYGFSGKLTSFINQLYCYSLHTNEDTYKILKTYAVYSSSQRGISLGAGSKRCSSIENRIIHSNRKYQRLIIEPEGFDDETVYLNGAFTSLPIEIQTKMLKTIPAFTNVHVAKFGYSVEYDVICSGEIDESLQLRCISGVFMAGQICGSTGYEEAAAQGWLAGVNAAMHSKSFPVYKLNKLYSYIGLLTYDLSKKGLRTPYRVLSARTPTRNQLRQRNAILRMLPLALATTSTNEKKQILWADLVKQFKILMEPNVKLKINPNKFNLNPDHKLMKLVQMFRSYQTYKH
ncbi:tRNA uridine 5-carboxymethylaminomethyl modification enzyme MnmG [Candidatus Hodgkinia cicadicola]|uniref:tRNA uridine 5-carboxymethylaminomethyl modification enzyme MnmG n=1 Tax=Candidatus Hodgkinia cicadicola TaxID=573658 RepID=A0ABX4MG07_9HYPH|nr:tRNA uridine 5-carboxymethylaminomethyl modification enzyme MnmG [Candidatus Hodgkinia cicadicola]PIM95911.1 tRNA uridine 5-carboxymethylaminomethyl modification enzyme MnmG [Candidatus Hodgkinia cicadicola]